MTFRRGYFDFKIAIHQHITSTKVQDIKRHKQNATSNEKMSMYERECNTPGFFGYYLCYK